MERSERDEAQLAALKAKLNRYQGQLDAQRSGAAPAAGARLEGAAAPSSAHHPPTPPPKSPQQSAVPSGSSTGGTGRVKAAAGIMSPPVAVVLEDTVEPAAALGAAARGGGAHKTQPFYQASGPYRSTEEARHELAAMDARASHVMAALPSSVPPPSPPPSSILRPPGWWPGTATLRHCLALLACDKEDETGGGRSGEGPRQGPPTASSFVHEAAAPAARSDRSDAKSPSSSRQRTYVDVMPAGQPVAARGVGHGVGPAGAVAPAADLSKPYKAPTVNWGSGPTRPLCRLHACCVPRVASCSGR